MNLQIREISFGYGLKKPLFSSFSAEIRPGHVTALLGPNGTGKTTLLKLCCGMLIPRKGEISLDSFRVSSRHKNALKEIFFVPDTTELPAVNAAVFGRITGRFYKGFDQSYYESLLERFSVPKEKKLTGLSFGQQKKVYLAFAFAANTTYLFLDEPTNGLDPNSMKTLKQVIAESADSGRSIVVSTHHINDVENLCDDFMVLDEQHDISHHSLQTILDKYHFGSSPVMPGESLYHEQTFGQVNYMRLRKEGEPVSQFNLALYMNAVLSKSLNAAYHEKYPAAV